ncbi:MAG: AtpZ/AtpI family protein [Candidatus Pacebacteria bacterium]|nr:AtpZ/AtpI family protein [Candidatus Paceibacterota bacterium]MBP9715764.1 AtpZ/AtpI family protein [Candidatus Paceibacterota bacterium]
MEKNIQKKWWVDGLGIAMKISSWIAVPIIVSLVLGKFLDKKYNTEPIIFISLTILAFMITIYGIVRFSMSYIKDIEKENIKNNDQK